MHLTLVFLGEVMPRRIATLVEIMEEAARHARCFDLNAAGTGTFGGPRSPKVIWAGVQDPSGSLVALQVRLTEQLAGRGFAVSRKAFSPHVTLGRVRGRQRVAALTAAVASANNTCFGIVPVQRVSLLQSTLSPAGSHYIPLHESQLQGV